MLQNRFVLSVLASLVFLVPSLHAQIRGEAEVWLTTPDRTSVLALQPNRLEFKKPTAQSLTIDVDDTQKFQSIDGFGFALTGGSAQLMMRMDAAHRKALLKELFGEGKNEIGVSYLRVSIGSSDMNDSVFTYDDLPAGVTDASLSHFDLGRDRRDVIPVLNEILAIHPGIKILASPWSAPSWMKTNGKPKDGSLKPEYYSAYAQYFVRYIEGMKTEGIAIDAVTVQNEPLNANNTPSMMMLAQEEDTFIKEALGPALRKAGIATKIILYDHNCDKPEYPLAILSDPQASAFVDGSGFHLYEGEISALTQVHEAFPGKNLYFTEQMVVDHPGDPALHIAEPVNGVLIGATRNWARNVLLWNLAADPKFGPHTDDGGCPVCEGAITLDGNQITRNVAFYVVAHASKFIAPGSNRIGSNVLPGLANVAFKTPSGKTVLIVANTEGTEQSFAIRSHGNAIVSKLSAGSVGTYVW